MADGPFDPAAGELVSREPTLQDLVDLCRELNSRGARYLVVGGFAVRALGHGRNTHDIDLVIDTNLENEAKVYSALDTLPDHCVRELKPGEVARNIVVRVADEILVDLMAKASGIDFAEAFQFVTVREIGGVAIPFANADLLWKMKRRAGREKDGSDMAFLRHYFASEGREPPSVD